MLTVRKNQATLHRQIRSQIRSQCQGKRSIPFSATDHEVSHGRDLTWILELTTSGSCDGRAFQATHLLITSLRTSPEGLLRLVRERWSIESWHWIRDTQLHEDDHRYKGNGAGVMASMRTAGMNLLRFAGFQSIRTGMQAVMHDITALLALARRQPELEPS